MFYRKKLANRIPAALCIASAGLLLAAVVATAAPTRAIPGTVTNTTSPNGVVDGTLIDSIAMDYTTGNMVFISVHSPKTSNPACSTNGTWAFVLPLTTSLQTQMFAALLSARSSGANVTLVGSGVCDTYSNVETLVTLIY
jgi:hypothetical protein